jgi:hypothetical protein
MRAFSLFVATAAVGALVMPGTAEPTKWSQAGTLDCTMGPSIGLARGGRQQARCVFKSAPTKLAERYTGRMEREGLDAGIPSGARLLWTVLTQTGKLPAKALVGRYTDATGQITFEEDDFAEAALCNKSKRLVCLRPAAGEARARENLAFGISALRLE